MIRRVIEAYRMLSNFSPSQIIERECLDPFDTPECEAFDLFVNELFCVGKACSNSCVERAPHSFTYVSSTGTARASSQGRITKFNRLLDSVLEIAFLCYPPSQRILLEELLDSVSCLIIQEELLELQDPNLASTMRSQQQRALEFWEKNWHSGAPLKIKRLARDPQRFIWAVGIAQSRCINMQMRVGALTQNANMLVPYAGLDA